MKYCTHCGAEIMEEAVICTKCGCWVSADNAKLQRTPLANPNQGTKLNVCALVGFILSMISIIFFINFMGLLALAGMIVSIVGLSQAYKNVEQRGKGFGIAGVVVGACEFLFGIFIWILIL